jgi:hypothetical protein
VVRTRAIEEVMVRIRTSQHRAGPGLEETVVIALAANRLARAIAVDEITEPLRSRVERWAGTGGDGPPVQQQIAKLVKCPVCVGWWASLAISLGWPGRMRLRRGVAVAGAQVLLSLAERLVSERGRGATHHADRAEHHRRTEIWDIGTAVLTGNDGASAGVQPRTGVSRHHPATHEDQHALRMPSDSATTGGSDVFDPHDSDYRQIERSPMGSAATASAVDGPQWR